MRYEWWWLMGWSQLKEWCQLMRWCQCMDGMVPEEWQVTADAVSQLIRWCWLIRWCQLAKWCQMIWWCQRWGGTNWYDFACWRGVSADDVMSADWWWQLLANEVVMAEELKGWCQLMPFEGTPKVARLSNEAVGQSGLNYCSPVLFKTHLTKACSADTWCKDG